MFAFPHLSNWGVLFQWSSSSEDVGQPLPTPTPPRDAIHLRFPYINICPCGLFWFVFLCTTPTGPTQTARLREPRPVVPVLRGSFVSCPPPAATVDLEFPRSSFL